MLKAILTDMRINTGIKFFPEDKEKKSYCIFKASSIFPDKKGIYFTAECRASNKACEEVMRLKLHEKSCIDLVANLQQYPKDGKLITSYEISEISICEHEFSQKKEETVETTKDSAQKEMENYLFALKTDPFQRGGK